MWHDIETWSSSASCFKGSLQARVTKLTIYEAMSTIYKAGTDKKQIIPISMDVVCVKMVCLNMHQRQYL